MITSNRIDFFLFTRFVIIPIASCLTIHKYSFCYLWICILRADRSLGRKQTGNGFFLVFSKYSFIKTSFFWFDHQDEYIGYFQITTQIWKKMIIFFIFIWMLFLVAHHFGFSILKSQFMFQYSKDGISSRNNFSRKISVALRSETSLHQIWSHTPENYPCHWQHSKKEMRENLWGFWDLNSPLYFQNWDSDAMQRKLRRSETWKRKDPSINFIQKRSH